MQFFRHPITTVVAIAAMIVPQVAAAAPRSWLLPSGTNFNGGDAWVTVDAALSTDLYYPDHPGQPWTPIATAPDGSIVQVENLSKGKLRLTFDLHLTTQGTYKLAVINNGVMGSYMLDGERKMLPRGTTTDTLAQAIPAGATEVWTAENNSRVETFVTSGVPNDIVFKPSGKGLEMVPVSHPTDLSVSEAATFQFLLDGKPAADIAVSAINGGVRYAPGLQQLELKTDAQGKVTIKWPTPGMWWVSASIGGGRGEGGPGGPGGPGGEGRPAGAGAPNSPGGPGAQGGEGPRRPMGPPQRRATYAMTVEVLG
jgi:hypothetical protein